MKPFYENHSRLLGIVHKLANYEDWKRESPDKNEYPIVAFPAMKASAKLLCGGADAVSNVLADPTVTCKATG
jgi:hypothetical protein